MSGSSYKTDEKTDFSVMPMHHSNQYIYVLLLRYPDLFSKIFRIFTRCKYNHASIGVSGSNGSFYSYVTKGFRKEQPLNHPTFKKREVPCELYRIRISDEICEVTLAALEDHEKNAHKFKYNSLGVVLCLLRIVWPMKNQYFCSQFVSEILEQMQAVTLEKHTALYLPDDFENMNELDLCFSGYLSQLVSQSKYKALIAV